MRLGYFWLSMYRPFPDGKHLVVAIDFFTKWVEAKPLKSITGKQIVNFVWEEITFSSVAHPQANGQVEVTNGDIVAGIRGRLDKDRKGWADELPQVLWAFRTTLKGSNRETPFSLVYGSEAVIPAEIAVPTQRVMEFNDESNVINLKENLNLWEERREIAAIREASNKQKIAKYYNQRVRERTLRPGDFVWRNNNASRVEDTGKLGPKWKGPYVVAEALENGAYNLKTHDGKFVPRTWHATNLKKFYV
ncbi:uncharacterized protein [Rutidosis leptorrhynchoides]|uniref:uncharacterized protein n=1 Tax=Rutidosis leptorrhynchoides TaxID=125765 RepID=UPI003A98D9A0